MDPTATPPLDLDAYLARIGVAGDGGLGPAPGVLERLHLGHITHIPFENLDLHLGRPIRLDLASLQAKLVEGRRGGYCFEHNTLFAAVLERLGFRVTRLAARVRLGTPRVNPRTHMLLSVEVEGAPWLVDVGFGADSPFLPIPLRAGEPRSEFGRTFRLVEDGATWVLQSSAEGAWSDLYAFTLEPQQPIDYELANFYTSSHPDSRFVQTLTAQARTPEARFVLRNRELEVVRDGRVEGRTIAGDDELLGVLAEHFGLEFPPGTRFLRRHQSTTEPSSAS